MGTPQIIWFVFAGWTLIYTLIHNGEYKKRSTYNFSVECIFIIIEYFFLNWGGFFK